MTLATKVANLLQDCALEPALALAQDQVKSAPADRIARHLYIDLLVLSGDYERADAQCKLALNFSPEEITGFGMLRNQLRAMASRDAWFTNGELPNFPGEPTPREQQILKLAIARREGAADETAAIIAQLDEEATEAHAAATNEAANFLRDGDDRTPYVLEALTTGGAYLWVDYARIASLELDPVTRPRDYAYRPATLELLDGASATVLLPAIYQGTPAESPLQLARQTRWEQDACGMTIGAGQRCLLVNDDLLPLHELTDLEPLLFAQGAEENV